MALTQLKNTAPEGNVNNVKLEIKKSGPYEYVDTENEGVKRVVSKQGGYLAFLDYGRQMKMNVKKGVQEYKQNKTVKHVRTEGEAKILRAEAEKIRLAVKNGEPIANENKLRRLTFEDGVEDFKNSETYKEMTDGYQVHIDNHIKHLMTYFKDYEPRKITTPDIEKYFRYQLDKGNLIKDGHSLKKGNGISVNTLGKHKGTMKKIMEYLLLTNRYGIRNNVVEAAKLPKVEVTIAGKTIKKSKIRYKPRPYSLEELNYTLNDALEHEDDRSIVLMIGLASLGGLRRSEISGLKLGNFFHDELMDVSEEMMIEGNFDMEYYQEHDELMLIDTAIMKIKGNNVEKLPKNDIIRIAAIPDCLKKIVDYYMEQRREIYEIEGRVISSKEQLYMPLVNIIRGEELNPEKLSRKWREYQVRRNKRIEKAGLKPIPTVRLHDLRHTHSENLGMEVAERLISYNMGHVVKDGNTTINIYMSERQPIRKPIINFWDSNIQLNWDKAKRTKVNAEGSRAYINASGHLIIGNAEKKRIMNLRKRFVLSEDEIAELLFNTAGEGSDSIDD